MLADMNDHGKQQPTYMLVIKCGHKGLGETRMSEWRSKGLEDTQIYVNQ